MIHKPIKIDSLPDGEVVYLKKNKQSGYRVIQPWKNEDGSINWFNFLTGGSWGNLIFVTIVVIVLLGTLREYSTNINSLLDCFRVEGMLERCVEAYGDKQIKLLP